MSKQYLIQKWMPWLFGIGLLLELSFQTFFQNSLGVAGSPTVWLLGGLITVFAAFNMGAFSAPLLSTPTTTTKPNSSWIIAVVLLAAIVVGAFLPAIFQDYPVQESGHGSDIIPSIQLYVKRLLGGESVYEPLVFDGWTVLPTYFPMMWLPYVISELLGIDYRWTAYGLFVLVVAIYNYRSLERLAISRTEAVVKAVLPFLMILILIIEKPFVFGYAVELTPVAYYLILCMSVFSRSAVFIAVGIFLCLLSRYAFTFWLPVYLLILWIERGFGFVFKVGLYVLIGVLLVYVVPFLSKNWSLVTDGLSYYQKTAEGQWQTQFWQESGAKPHHLFQGLSYAGWIYDHVAGSVQERLTFNQNLHKVVSFIAAALLLAGYFFWRKEGLNVRFYLIVGLKFYLLIFYSLLYVPFSYLFMLPLFISLALLYELKFSNTP